MSAVFDKIPRAHKIDKFRNCKESCGFLSLPVKLSTEVKFGNTEH